MPPLQHGRTVLQYLTFKQQFSVQLIKADNLEWCLLLRVMVSCHCETSPQTGRGNPPVRGKMCRKVPGRVGVAAIFSGNRYLVPFNRGIATPVCALTSQ